MTAPFTPPRPIRVAIRTIGISAASPLEAQRLADTLPAALNASFSALTEGATPAKPQARRPADRVAADVVRAVMERIEGRK